MIKIAASLLACDFSQMGAEAQRMLSSGADSLHFDIMDGVGPVVAAALRKHCPYAHIDCHLMVTDPINYIEPLANAGVSSITFHYETILSKDGESSTLQNCLAIVRRLRELQIQVGIAINPETHIDKHLLFVVQKTNPDLVLVMTVQPGKGGQKMLEDCIEKVRVLNNQMPDLSIQVDGGINEENAKLVIDAGASILVAGTLLFNSKEPKAIISRIKNFVDKD